MAVTQKPTTGSNGAFAFGQPIFREDLQELIEAMNWVAGNRFASHISMPCAPESDWGTSGQTPGILFVSESQVSGSDAADTYEYMHTDIWVSENALTGGIAAKGKAWGQGDASATANIIFSGSAGVVTSSLTWTEATDEDVAQATRVSWDEVGRGFVEVRLLFGISGTAPSGGLMKNLQVEDLPVTSTQEMAARAPYMGTFWNNDYSGHWSTTARFDCGNMSGSDLPSGSQELTVGLWFKTKDIGSAKRTLWSWGSTMHTRLTGSNLTCQFPKTGGAANIVFTDVWDDDTWHHLVMAYSGANVITNDRVVFYMDGERLDASWDADPTGSLGEWSDEFRIGSHYAGTAYNFDDGNLDELTVWDSYARHIFYSTGSSDVASMTGSYNSPGDPTLSNLGTPIHQWRWDTYKAGESLEDVFGANHGTLVSSGVSRSLDTP